MNQRLIAAFVAVPLVLVLAVYAFAAKLPYAYETTGDTINVLGQNDTGARILQVVGHKTYPDDGDLQMTFIQVSPAGKDGDDHSTWLTGFEALEAWFNPDKAILPYEDIHPQNETADQNKQQGAVQMKTSQDDAIYVALTELGYKVPNQLQVAAVTPGSPADGVLQPYDVLKTANGKPIPGKSVDAQTAGLLKIVQSTPKGGSVTLGIERDGKAKTVSIKPVPDPDQNNEPRVGITQGIGYKFPFTVSINIDPNIGGPSAGLMFSLAVYDYLTPGSLTGGHNVAGTGEILPDGTVGPIGGIQQKIITARKNGVQLYFVPKDNCADGLRADAGNMRIVMATTMHEARTALETYVKDPTAALPSCEDAGQ